MTRSRLLILIAILLFIGLGLLCLMSGLSGRQPFVRLGLITPPPTPDPFSPYRAALQPWAQGDIEAVGPIPRYHITARLTEDGSQLEGVAQVTVPQPSALLVFRLYPNVSNYNGSLSLKRISVNDTPMQLPAITDLTALQLPVMPQAEGQLPKTAIVSFDFTVQLGQADSNYTLFGWHDQTLSLPGFYPTLAARQAGQWVVDTPPSYGDVLFNEVAHYQLDLTVPSKLSVIASGVTLNRLENADGSRTWQIAGGPLRDMTVMVGQFEAASEQAAGATVTSYYRTGHEAAGFMALAHATAALRLYSDFYGAYPYTELDMVEAPLNVRGMEYSGLVLIGEDLYRAHPELLTFLVAHEVAHQWWYGVVGSNPYQHPWLDEGLTEYSAFDYYQGVFGQTKAAELLTGRWSIPFDYATQGGIDGHVNQPATAFGPSRYELLVYTKAALFFHALREQLGQELYHQVLQSYYAENRYQVVTPQTFLETAERVSGQNLQPLVEEWLR